MRQILKNVHTSKYTHIDVSHEDNPRQHAPDEGRCYPRCFFGFSGEKEHADLLMEHLQVRTFEVGHELDETEYHSLAPNKDKTTKLTTTNSVLQKSKYPHIPIGDKTHLLTPSGTIWWHLQKIGPGQKCSYC